MHNSRYCELPNMFGERGHGGTCCGVAELAAGDDGICPHEASCTNLSPGALVEDLQVADVPVENGCDARKPQVSLACKKIKLLNFIRLDGTMICIS